jgi:cyclic pyranopterin phosphate synthase
MVDQFGRLIDYARVSVTARCNLRCVYCMPEKGEETGAEPTFEQLMRVCAALAALGIRKIRITGGEPLMREDIADILRAVNRMAGIENVSLTTNGLLLPRLMEELSPGELDGLNINLNSHDSATYRAITRTGSLKDALAGLHAALDKGFPNIKINCVAIAELNAGDLEGVAQLARERDIAVRFIEVMPVGLGKQYTPLPQGQIAARLAECFGPLTPCPGSFGNGPAVYYSLPGFKGKIGFISALSHRFCEHCNRVRVTSGGYLKTCLHFRSGLDLRPLHETDVPEEEFARRMERAILEKPLGHRFYGATGEYEEEAGIMSRIGG